jgi:hypothetical protein
MPMSTALASYSAARRPSPIPLQAVSTEGHMLLEEPEPALEHSGALCLCYSQAIAFSRSARLHGCRGELLGDRRSTRGRGAVGLRGRGERREPRRFPRMAVHMLDAVCQRHHVRLGGQSPLETIGRPRRHSPVVISGRQAEPGGWAWRSHRTTLLRCPAGSCQEERVPTACRHRST